MPAIRETLEIALEHHRAGRFKEAEKLYRQILGQQPNHAGALCLIGMMAHQLGKKRAAARYLQKAVDANPLVADYHYNLGMACSRLRKFDEAITHFRHALALKPTYARAHNNLGAALEREGKLEEAICHYEKALAIAPDDVKVHHNLAFTRKYKAGDPEFSRIEKLLTNPTVPARRQSLLHFAVAKMYDDCDQFDKAFFHARQANDSDHPEFSIEAFTNRVTDLIETFSAEFFKKRRSFGSESELPVFVVGMPRSGRSLIEHIIAGLPAAFGAGGRSDIREITNRLREAAKPPAPYPQCAALFDRVTARPLADEHIGRLRDLSGGALRVIDTRSGNFRRLGIIGLLFPKARVIHCRRHPLDLGLACYFSDFNHQQPYAADLTTLGLYHRQHERLMAHWRTVLPSPMLEVQYERLVGDPGSVSREIIDFCGLEWDERCLSRPYRSRPIRTDKNAGGDRAVDQGFVGRWKNYQAFLGPLKAALEWSDE